MSAYKLISARVDAELFKQVEKIAKAEDLTVTQIIRRALRELVQRKNAKGAQ